MIVIMGAVFRLARPHIMKAAGVPEGMPGIESVKDAHFSSEEADLMATVFKSALRLFSGSAKREELAGELSDKLYGQRDEAEMKALGIELVKPDGTPASVHSAESATSPKSGTKEAKEAQADEASPESPANNIRKAMLTKVWAKAAMNPELSLIPIVLVGMVVVGRVRRRNSPEDAFMLPDLSLMNPADTEPYTMTHAVHSMTAEDFELLVALVYQRQGYRVEMPAGVSGGRGGDFTLIRKAEKLLVQCKKLPSEHKVNVERVRELHEAAVAAGATRGVFVASCGFSWDARNFAKSKGLTIINARTLDSLLNVTRQKADDDLLAVAEWAPKFMSKVHLTPPHCPACEAPMDQVRASTGSVWVCSQRPECRGRRNARKYQKAAAPKADGAEKQDANAEEFAEIENIGKVSYEKQTPREAQTTAPASAAAANPRSPRQNRDSEIVSAGVASRSATERTPAGKSSLK